jgi:hypothetical protein
MHGRGQFVVSLRRKFPKNNWKTDKRKGNNTTFKKYIYVYITSIIIIQKEIETSVERQRQYFHCSNFVKYKTISI